MPRIYKCRKCGKQHGPPTGKHCRARDSSEEEERSSTLDDIMPALEALKKQMEDMPAVRELSKQMAEMNTRMERVENGQNDRQSEQDSEERDGDDGDGFEQADDEAGQEAAASYATPESLRKDVKAMQRAAARIALYQQDDSDDEELGLLRKARLNGKKSGSVMTATDNIRERIDWPQMHVKRTVNGKRVGVNYEDLKVEEFVLGFVAMLRSPRCKMDRDVMLEILEMLMQDTVDFAWENARAFYKMLGVDVETGVRQWTDEEQISKMRLQYCQKRRKLRRSRKGRAGGETEHR